MLPARRHGQPHHAGRGVLPLHVLPGRLASKRRQGKGRALPRFMDEIRAVIAGDPAAQGLLATATTSTGLHAIWMHRVTHQLWQRKTTRGLSKIIRLIARSLTQIDIHPSAVIGSPVLIDHGTGVVIGPNTVIGSRTLIYQGATIAAAGSAGPATTVIGSDCMIGSGATVLRGVQVGSRCNIRANAVVATDLPDNCVAVGVPAQFKSRDALNPFSSGPVDAGLLLQLPRPGTNRHP